MGRYKEETSDSSLADAIITIATGGLPLLLGGIPTTYETRITDKETGKTGVGSGSSKQEAHDRAWKELKK